MTVGNDNLDAATAGLVTAAAAAIQALGAGGVVPPEATALATAVSDVSAAASAVGGRLTAIGTPSATSAAASLNNAVTVLRTAANAAIAEIQGALGIDLARVTADVSAIATVTAQLSKA